MDLFYDIDDLYLINSCNRDFNSVLIISNIEFIDTNIVLQNKLTNKLANRGSLALSSSSLLLSFADSNLDLTDTGFNIYRLRESP